MQELKRAILNTFEVSEPILEEFVSKWEKVSFSKNSILSEPDKTDKYLYFTLEGVQKAYYLKEGKENIISFTQQNHFSCAPESFLTQVPSKYYFECITDSVFYRLPYHNFEVLIKEHNEILTFLLKALMMLVNNITTRFINQSTMTIEEKYKLFMKNDAHLINSIPHKEIANFLKINPSNFSKLINKVKV